MKNRSIVVGLGALVIVALVSLGIVLSRDTMAQESRSAVTVSKGDVVMMRCNTVGTFSVAAYQGSVGAPARRADRCPQALSELLRDGFRIWEVEMGQGAEHAVYVLTR